MKAALAAAAASVLLAACGSSSSGQSASSSSSPSPSPSATTTPSGPVLQTLTVSETEFSLSPSKITLAKPGTYDFKVVNAGTTTHALEITGNGIDAKTDNLSAGSNADLKVTLPAGTFEMFCPIDGHKGLGMDGSIKVNA